MEAQQAECSRLGVQVKAAQQAAKKSARPGGGQLQGDLGVEIVALRCVGVGDVSVAGMLQCSSCSSEQCKPYWQG